MRKAEQEETETAETEEEEAVDRLPRPSCGSFDTVAPCTAHCDGLPGKRAFFYEPTFQALRAVTGNGAATRLEIEIKNAAN